MDSLQNQDHYKPKKAEPNQPQLEYAIREDIGLAGRECRRIA